MPALRLGRLPDRTPVRISFIETPVLNQALADYPELYLQTYGQDEPVTERIPEMLCRFLESDRAFAASKRPEGRR